MGFKHYDFTVNNPEDWRPTWDPERMEWLKYQLESGDEKKTTHIQGAISYKCAIGKKTLNAKHFNNRAHLGPIRNLKALSAYVWKEGGWERTEYGKEPESLQGKRTDLEQVCDAIKAGAGKRKLAEDFPVQVVKFHKGLEILKRWLHEDDTNEFTKPTSKTVEWEDIPIEDKKVAYIHDARQKTWCRYMGEHTVIIRNTAQQNAIDWDYLRDEGRWVLDVKYGDITFQAKTLYFCVD